MEAAIFILLTLLSPHALALAQSPTEVTVPLILQKAEMFEQKYSDLAQKKDDNLSFSCNEKSIRDEALALLAKLKHLDSLPLNEKDRCHQKRLESKVHGLVGRLFRDSSEGEISFNLLKAGISVYPNCSEMIYAYVNTVANFSKIGRLKRSFVMGMLKVKLDQEVITARSKIEILRKLGVPSTETQRLSSILNDY